MENHLTISELEKRWHNVLKTTDAAVAKNPDVYHKLKFFAQNIVANPLDIKEYLPTTEKLSTMLTTMDPGKKGSIFSLFSDRITPANIWQVSLLRVECKDLLEHLKAFDQWRMQNHGLTVVK